GTPRKPRGRHRATPRGIRAPRPAHAGRSRARVPAPQTAASSPPSSRTTCRRTTRAPSGLSCVRDGRAPVPAPARRTVEHEPERPHEVHVARVLGLLPGRVEQLARPEVANAAVAPGEHREDRPLVPGLVLGAVV